MSPVLMRPSAYKHGFDFDEVLYIMQHPRGARSLGRTSRGERWVYVGFPYEGSDRRVELLVEKTPPRTIEVFHCMDLTDNFRDVWAEE
jgi:hypothetical protein